MNNITSGQQIETGGFGTVPLDVLPVKLSPQVEDMLDFLPVKDNFGSWMVTLPPLPADIKDPSYQDILTIHQVYGVNKRADKHGFLAYLLTDNQALRDYADDRGEAAEETLAELRHKAIRMGFPLDGETNQFDQEYLQDQRAKSSQRAKAITEGVTKLMWIIEAKKKAMEQFVPNFQAIEDKYRQVDQDFSPRPVYGSESWDQWIKARLGIFDGKVVFGTDSDLTLTTSADYLQYVPGSHHAESLLNSYSREVFPVVFVRYWQEALRKIPEVFGRVGMKVGFRPGVWQFFEKAQSLGQPIVVMSANFEPIIRGVLQRLPHGLIKSVYAVRADDISATDKKTVLREIVSQNQGRSMTVFEDGHSGLPLTDADASGLVGCYFALEGSEFHQALQQKNLPYYSFRDFNDNLATLNKLGVL